MRGSRVSRPIKIAYAHKPFPPTKAFMASSLLNGDNTLDVSTSDEGSGTGPSTTQAMEDDQRSPKRKPNSCKDRRGVERPEHEVRRRKIESKPSWKNRLIKSLRRRSAPPLSEMEASDFASYRHHPSPKLGARPSPLLNTKGSPLPYQKVQMAIDKDADGLPNEIKGGTPLHYYVWVDSRKKERTDFLVSLLTVGEVDVNCRTDAGNTALHLAVKKGDLSAVKILLSFGADVNLINCHGHTPLDIATGIYINQECRVAVSNAAVDRRTRPHRPSDVQMIPGTLHEGDSPLLSKIVPQRPKFTDYHLSGDLDGWVSVDFTDGPPVSKKLAPMSTEGRVRDLTEPVHMTTDDVQSISERTQQLSSSNTNGIHATVAEDDRLRLSYDSILNLLHAVGGRSGDKLQDTYSKPISLSGQHVQPDLSLELKRSIRLAEYEDGTAILNLCEALQDTINMKMEQLASIDSDEAIALTWQQQEMTRYNKTFQISDVVEGIDGGARAGSRVLCLDGGGIRGLIQIEVLAQIERVTGRKIVNLFDWIIGTSTGALIAICLIYGKMSLEDVRRLYFRMKNEVFSGSSYGFDTEKLERLLLEHFPPHMRMDCTSPSDPKILVSAVYKKTTPSQLHFFNNCFNDEYSKQLVWKVARYTTAAPMYFKECDDYVDGGVLANNPSETGLTAIQNFHHSIGSRLPIAIVVSVGSGVYPAEALGKIDVQDFLFFGKQWLKLRDLIGTIRKRTKDLIHLLTNALVESEIVADNTKARCGSQGIPFYRFSPKLAETVATGETDNGILVNMLISTIIQTVPAMENLREQFSKIADAHQKDRYRKRKAAKVTSV